VAGDWVDGQDENRPNQDRHGLGDEVHTEARDQLAIEQGDQIDGTWLNGASR
jgi:hypothetical protein